MTNILYQGFFFQVYVPIPCLGYFSYYLICYHFFWSLKYSIRIPSISKYLVHLALRVFGSTLWLIIFTLTFKAMVDFLRFCFDHAHVGKVNSCRLHFFIVFLVYRFMAVQNSC